MTEKLKWGGFTYETAFTLGRYYDLCEGISDLQEGIEGGIAKGISALRANLTASCKILLKGSTKEAQEFLDSGLLIESILQSEDANAAFAFKGRLDFLSLDFMKQGTALMGSAPDLTDKLTAKTQKSLAQKSRKAMKEEPAHSG